MAELVRGRGCRAARMKIVFCAVITATTLTVLVTLHQLSIASGIGYRSNLMVFTPSGGGIRLFAERNDKKSTNNVLQRGGEERSVYLMALGYSGQQAAGINAFTSFQCWAAHSGQPVTIVEPIVRKSRIVASFQANSDAMELSDFFDMEHFNYASRIAGFPQVIGRRRFLEEGSKNVLFVQFINESSMESVIWPGGDKTNLCYSGKSPKKLLNRMIHNGYCVRKIVNLKPSSLTKMKLQEILGRWNHESVTVVVSNWKAPTSPQPECKRVGRLSTKFQFYPSPRLLKDASVYTNTHNINGASYNAVMIRLEHAAILAQQFPRDYSIEGCLKELVAIVESIPGANNQTPVVAADIGIYGSNSWDWAVDDKEELATGISATKRAMQSLLRNEMSFEEWEGTFVQATGGVSDRGYIAALQRTIASRAKCLILLGGGNFQDLALLEYLRIHGNKGERCVHLVCIQNQEEMKRRIAL